MSRISLFSSILFVCGFSGAAFGVDLSNCRVYEVGFNPFEEGLGVFGDPSVDGDSQNVSVSLRGSRVNSVRVGQRSWDREDSIFTRSVLADGTVKITVQPKEETETSTVQVNIYKSERGTVYIRENHDSDLEFTAKFDCSSTQVAENAAGDDANTERLTFRALKREHPQVAQNIEAQDFNYAIGDADISILKTTYYKVFKAEGSRVVVGYLAVVDFRNSELDSDEVATFRFDRNGCLVNGFEFE